MRKNKEEYVINVVKHCVGIKLWRQLEEQRETIELEDIVKRCCTRVSSAVCKMSFQKLGALCEFAQEDSGVCAWSFVFYQVTSATVFLRSSLNGRNPREILRQTVYAIILCLAYDILKQDEYRKQDEAHQRSFALH